MTPVSVLRNYRIIRKCIEYIPDLQNPTHRILERFQQKYTNTCSKEYGYILQVIRVVQIFSSRISIYNANIIVECDIEVECLKPKIGEQVHGTIQQIFPQGLIVLIENCMKVFIPSPKGQYHKQQEIQFMIVQTRFQKGKYDCIGSEMEVDDKENEKNQNNESVQSGQTVQTVQSGQIVQSGQYGQTNKPGSIIIF